MAEEESTNARSSSLRLFASLRYGFVRDSGAFFMVELYNTLAVLSSAQGAYFPLPYCVLMYWMIFSASSCGSGAPYVLIILFTVAVHCAFGNFGCMVM